MPDRVLLGVVGDVHGTFPSLDRVLERIVARGARGILLVGDLGEPSVRPRRPRPGTEARYLACVEEVLRRVASTGLPFAYVPGNHDLPDLTFPGNADGRLAEVAGVRVAGIGGAGPARFGFAYEWGEDDVRARNVPEADVLLVHCPPARTPLDVVPRGEHVGSEAIRERAAAHRGVLVCGHIHESPGAVRIGDCLCVNAGGLGEPFGRVQAAFVDLDRTGGADHAAEHEDFATGTARSWRLADLTPHAS